jgi:anti-anti-sigma factor
MQQTTISTTSSGPTWRLAPRGEVDLDAWPALTRALAERPTAARRMEVDMTGVDFMDITGLRLVVHARGLAQRHDLPLRFTGWRSQPLRLLRLAADTFPAGGFAAAGQPVTADSAR